MSSNVDNELPPLQPGEYWFSATPSFASPKCADSPASPASPLPPLRSLPVASSSSSSAAAAVVPPRGTLDAPLRERFFPSNYVSPTALAAAAAGPRADATPALVEISQHLTLIASLINRLKGQTLYFFPDKPPAVGSTLSSYSGKVETCVFVNISLSDLSVAFDSCINVSVRKGSPILLCHMIKTWRGIVVRNASRPKVADGRSRFVRWDQCLFLCHSDKLIRLCGTDGVLPPGLRISCQASDALAKVRQWVSAFCDAASVARPLKATEPTGTISAYTFKRVITAMLTATPLNNQAVDSTSNKRTLPDRDTYTQPVKVPRHINNSAAAAAASSANMSETEDEDESMPEAAVSAMPAAASAAPVLAFPIPLLPPMPELCEVPEEPTVDMLVDYAAAAGVKLSVNAAIITWVRLGSTTEHKLMTRTYADSAVQSLCCEENLVNGLRHGSTTWYYGHLQNQVVWQGMFCRGQLQGPVTRYSQQGAIEECAVVSNNTLLWSSKH